MKNGVRFFLLALTAATLTLSITPAASSGEPPVQVVVWNGSAFAEETLDGTATGSLPAVGAEPESFAAASTGAVVYDDSNGSDGGGDGPVWLQTSSGNTEVDSSSHDFGASISYDGSKVTFARRDPTTGGSDIYVVNSDGSDLTLVAEGQGNNHLESPEFSPDGSSIAYICRPADTPAGTGLGCGPSAAGTYSESGIMLMNDDGTDKRLIVAGKVTGADGDTLAWSPDGQWITNTACVYSAADPTAACKAQVFAYKTDGSDLLQDEDQTSQITNEDGPAVIDPQFASDGSEILFLKIVDNQWASFGIDQDGTNEHQLGVTSTFEVVPPATGGGPAATVSPTDPPVTGAGVPVVFKSPFNLPQCNGFLIEAGGGALTDCVPVSTGALNFSENTTFSVATDDSIAYDDVNHGATDANQNPVFPGAGPVWLVGPNRSPVELDASPYDFGAAISPDGSEVIFARLDPATQGSDLFVVDANGSGLARVASGGGNDLLSSPRFSPDRSSIAYFCAPAGSPEGTGLGCGPTAAGTYADSGVMLMSADGGDQRMIVSGATDAAIQAVEAVQSDPVAWSPDGKWVTTPGCVGLVPDVSNECNSDQAFAYRTDGSDAFNFLDPSDQITDEPPSPGAAVIPQFCGSSTQILFQESWISGFGQPLSYLVDRDGTDRHEISLWPGGDPGRAECVPPATGGGPEPTVNVAQPLPFPRGTVVIPNTTVDSPSPIPQCRGFLAETSTFAFTSCVQCHASINVMGAYDVAADGSIACLDTTKTETDEGPVWLGRPGKAPVELDPSLEDTDPAISPDGSKVAFVRWDPTTQSSDLYVINADGSGLKLLDSGVGVPRVAFPAFSPDGSTIAYLAGSEGVKLVTVDGSQTRLVVKGQENGPLSWSPDAKLLAMVTNGQVYTYRTDGSDLYDQLDSKRQITHETDQWGASSPQFNHDGSQILYLRNLDDRGDTGNYPYAIDSDGTNRQEVFLSPDPCTEATCDGALDWGIFVPPATGASVPRAVRPSQATVPNVHALSRRAATRRLARVRLTGKVAQRRFSSRVARGHVLSQYPRARAQASLKSRRGRTVKLVLSRGRRPAKKRR